MYSWPFYLFLNFVFILSLFCREALVLVAEMVNLVPLETLDPLDLPDLTDPLALVGYVSYSLEGCGLGYISSAWLNTDARPRIDLTGWDDEEKRVKRSKEEAQEHKRSVKVQRMGGDSDSTAWMLRENRLNALYSSLKKRRKDEELTRRREGWRAWGAMTDLRRGREEAFGEQGRKSLCKKFSHALCLFLVWIRMHIMLCSRQDPKSCFSVLPRWCRVSVLWKHFSAKINIYLYQEREMIFKCGPLWSNSYFIGCLRLLSFFLFLLYWVFKTKVRVTEQCHKIWT